MGMIVTEGMPVTVKNIENTGKRDGTMGTVET